MEPDRPFSYRFILFLIFSVLLAACSAAETESKPTLSPLETQGRGVFQSFCSRCHGTSGDTVIVGPSLAGVATRAGGRVEGLDAEGYIRQSILTPNAYVVEGFPRDIMPGNFETELTAEKLDAVVAFLLTLE